MEGSSKLFDREGYISIREYLDDIALMDQHGSWSLPIKVGDRIQLFLLRVISRFSWLADNLFVAHASSVSPAYQVLLSYLQKKRFFDSFREKNLRTNGYFAYYLEKKVFINGRAWQMNGQGVATEKSTALSIAIGEMLERAVSGLYDSNRKTIHAAPDELMKKYPVLYPPKFHRFLPSQVRVFSELQNDDKSPLSWVEGRNFITGEVSYIPQQITSWFRENRKKNKSVLIEATTNGAAGYFTKSGAVLRGLLEVVQRDAFFVHWLTMIPPRVIDRSTLPEKIQKRIQEFDERGISLFVLDGTAISIPSVFVVGINERAEVPQVVVSGATALTFETAIQNALNEMVIVSEMFNYVEHHGKFHQNKTEVEPFIAELGKLTRQLYWRGSERVSRFQWFILGEKVRYEDISGGDAAHCNLSEPDQLKRCLAILKKQGSDYYPIVYFPKHSIQAEISFHIAQVFIPKAFPMYLTEYYGTFDSDRLSEFARSKGITEWKINPYPHMFS